MSHEKYTTPMNRMSTPAEAPMGNYCFPIEGEVHASVHNLRGFLRNALLTATQFEELNRNLLQLTDTALSFFRVNRSLGDEKERRYMAEERLNVLTVQAQQLRNVLEGKTEHDGDGVEKVAEQLLGDILGFDIDAADTIGREVRRQRTIDASKRDAKAPTNEPKQPTDPDLEAHTANRATRSRGLVGGGESHRTPRFAAGEA